MFFFRIGRRVINLAHMVQLEELGAGDDAIRVTMVSGKEFDGAGPDARRLIAQADTLASNPFTIFSHSSVSGEPEGDESDGGQTLREKGA